MQGDRDWPLSKRNRPNSLRLFLDTIKLALTPASSTNTGAQKCVTQRVANIAERSNQS
jgi:hypothetical protein